MFSPRRMSRVTSHVPELSRFGVVMPLPPRFSSCMFAGFNSGSSVKRISSM